MTVTFDWPVKASATSTLNIAIGGQARAATYASGNGSRSVTFAYAVKRGDNGAVTVPDGSIASGTITDLSGVNGPQSLAFKGASVPTRPQRGDRAVRHDQAVGAVTSRRPRSPWASASAP